MSLWMNYIRSGYAKTKKKKQQGIGRSASLHNVSSYCENFGFAMRSNKDKKCGIR